MKLEHSLTPHTKISSEWIKDVNINPDTVKLLKENIGRTLFDINQSSIFLDSPSRVMKIKTKIKVRLKPTSFCIVKETIKKKKKKKTNHRMGENLFKQSNQQRINLQSIQTSHAAL